MATLDDPATQGSPRPGAGTGSVPASGVPARFEFDRDSDDYAPQVAPQTVPGQPQR